MMLTIAIGMKSIIRHSINSETLLKEFELTGISLFRGNDTKPAVYTGYSGDTYSVTLEDYTFSVTAQDIATTLNIPGEEIVNFRTFTREERTKFNDNAYDRAGKSERLSSLILNMVILSQLQLMI